MQSKVLITLSRILFTYLFPYLPIHCSQCNWYSVIFPARIRLEYYRQSPRCSHRNSGQDYFERHTSFPSRMRILSCFFFTSTTFLFANISPSPLLQQNLLLFLFLFFITLFCRQFCTYFIRLLLPLWECYSSCPFHLSFYRQILSSNLHFCFVNIWKGGYHVKWLPVWCGWEMLPMLLHWQPTGNFDGRHFYTRYLFIIIFFIY